MRKREGDGKGQDAGQGWRRERETGGKGLVITVGWGVMPPQGSPESLPETFSSQRRNHLSHLSHLTMLFQRALAAWA